MDIESPEMNAYLAQLNTMTGGDPEAQVSMHEVGAALGLGEDEAGQEIVLLIASGRAVVDRRFEELPQFDGGFQVTLGVDENENE